MKKISIIFVLVALVLVLAACSGNNDDVDDIIPAEIEEALPNISTDTPSDTTEDIAEDTVPEIIQITESPNSAYLQNIINILESRNFALHYFTTSIVMSGARQQMTNQVEVHVFSDNSIFIDQSSTSPFSDGIYNHFIDVLTPTQSYWLQMGAETYSVNELDEPIVSNIASWYQTIFTMPIRFQGYMPSPIGDYEVYALSFGNDDMYTTIYLSHPDSLTENHGFAFLEWRFMGTITTAEIHSFNTNPDRTRLTIEIPEHFERTN